MNSQQVSIATPPGFTGLPIADAQERDSAAVTELAERIAEQSQQPREQVAESLTAVASSLAGANVQVFGKFAVGETEPALATLVLATTPLQQAAPDLMENNRHTVVDALLQQYRARNPDAEARRISLPIGPALASVVAGAYQLPPEATGRAEETVRPVFRNEFQIPSPEGDALIMLTISADSASGWEEIAEQSIGIANSLSILRGEE